MRTGKPLTMNPELVLENSSPAAVYTLPNTIIYLKAIKCLNIRLSQNGPGTNNKGAKDWRSSCTMAVKISEHCVGN